MQNDLRRAGEKTDEIKDGGKRQRNIKTEKKDGGIKDGEKKTAK